RCSSRPPMLVLQPRSGERLQLASLEGLGALHELAEELYEARWRAPAGAAVSATLAGSPLRYLFEAGMALTSELSLDAVLRRLTEVAAELTEARDAALGVLETTGSHHERFIRHGLVAAGEATIGAPPRGH